MDTTRLLRLLPTMPMIVEAFLEAGWECHGEVKNMQQIYRGIRLYHGQTQLQPDVLYLLRPEERKFPVDDYSYLSAAPIPGSAST